jgi:hypothetical protein
MVAHPFDRPGSDGDRTSRSGEEVRKRKIKRHWGRVLPILDRL